MSDDIRSIRKALPSYVIAAGTQVVLKVSKAITSAAEESQTKIGRESPEVGRESPEVGRESPDPARFPTEGLPAAAESGDLLSEVSAGSGDPRPAIAGYRKSGTVGVIVQCPPSNDEPYEIQFTDGTTTKAYFHELTLRRKEVEMELERLDVDLLPYVIYRCQVGSKAFGLAGEDADDDLRGIYLPPAGLHWGLRRLPEQIELGKASGRHRPPVIIHSSDNDSTDEVYWELEKFLLLALNANPNVLETLWTPVLHFATPLAHELRGLRQAFLSQHLYKTYSGYVLSQFRRMAATQKTQGTFKTKHAMHLIRLLYSGIHALRTGEILIDVGQHREELLGIKRGELTFDQVMQQALALDKQFQEEFERTTLPEQPDFEAVNAFLVKARRSAVEVST